MRLWVTNWVLKDYANRVQKGLRFYTWALLLVYGLACVCLGSLLTVIAYRLAIPFWYVVLLALVIALDISILHMYKKPRLKVETNVKPKSVEYMIALTEPALEGLEVQDRVYPSEQSVVIYCDTLIRDKLCYVLGRDIYIPRRVTGCVFTRGKSTFQRLLKLVGGSGDGTLGYYTEHLDIANVFVSQELNSAVAAVVLHEMVHRYTRDEAECRIITCLLAWLSDDPAMFMYERSWLAMSHIA